MAGRYDHMNSKSTAVASHINVYVRSYHCNTIYIYQDMYRIGIREKECNSHIYNQFLLSFNDQMFASDFA
jgi:hypothetical protein